MLIKKTCSFIVGNDCSGKLFAVVIVRGDCISGLEAGMHVAGVCTEKLIVGVFWVVGCVVFSTMDIIAGMCFRANSLCLCPVKKMFPVVI